jgi:4-amino-4-deoxychorismate lyase
MNQPLFIETIRLTDGQLFNLRFHNKRLNDTRYSHFGGKSEWDLTQLITVPEDFKEGLFKCRMTYGEQIEKIEFEPYQPRLVQRLRLINSNGIEYGSKYQNRASLNELFAQRGDADDVLIIKNGFVTDTSYANIVFWNGQQWITPDTFLLAGTQRARLLEEGIIVEQKIRAQEIPKYSHARLINSMLDFESTPPILLDSSLKCNLVF